MLTIGETLSDINNDINEIKKHEDNQYLRNVFEYAFDPAKKFLLPEGLPELKQKGISAVEAKGTFWQEARKFSTYCRADIKPIRREQLFIQAVEELDRESAAIMIAVKEQTLSELYPNITVASLKEVGYFK